MPAGKIAHRYKALFIGIGAIALILIGAGAGVALLLSGAALRHDISHPGAWIALFRVLVLPALVISACPRL